MCFCFMVTKLVIIDLVHSPFPKYQRYVFAIMKSMIMGEKDVYGFWSPLTYWTCVLTYRREDGDEDLLELESFDVNRM